MKTTVIWGLALLLTAAMVQAQTADPIPKDLAEVEGGQDLEKVKRSKFQETYVNTEIDFTRYSKIYKGDAYFD